MKPVTREEVCRKNKIFEDMLRTEKHHDHEIVKDAAGKFRWKEKEGVNKLLKQSLNLNDLWVLFYHLGCNKNSEIIRDLYRKMGYSLLGYWEIFYWETNNQLAEEYRLNYNKKNEQR